MHIAMIFNLFSQEPSNRPTCQNEAFDQEVNSYLNYSAPVIGVEQLADYPDDFLILDARVKEEYQVSHIPGARFLSYNNPDWTVLDNVSEKMPIVVYCSIGYRSEKMANKLKKRGFLEVYNLYGSIFEWANRGYPLETPQGDTTNRIHTYNKKWSQWVLNPNLKKTW